MKQVQANKLKIGNKYCIIIYNSWYESKLKNICTMYNYTQYTFNTKEGDIYLRYYPKNKKWQWQHPYIFDDRDEAILQVGLILFKGGLVKRSPHSQEKHIDLCLKHIPEKMI